MSELRRYRRTGEVIAHRLPRAKEWRDGSGNTLHARAGDFWVTDVDGSNGRSVGFEAFAATYELVQSDRYRRVGEVLAHPAAVGETVLTLEGEAVAAAGDWLVQDANGNRWFVPGGVFGRSYGRVDA